MTGTSVRNTQSEIGIKKFGTSHVFARQIGRDRECAIEV